MCNQSSKEREKEKAGERKAGEGGDGRVEEEGKEGEGYE